jgi:hypothetical protein
MSQVEVMATPPRLGKGSTLIADRTYYLPTYLHDKDNPGGQSWLFTRRVVVWQQGGGQTQRRAVLDVRAYPDGDAMINDIEGHPDWLEAPAEADGNPRWMPEGL